MKAPHDMWMYAGHDMKLFRAGDEIPEGWYDSPVAAMTALGRALGDPAPEPPKPKARR